MKSKITTEVDSIDKIKLDRMAATRGMSTEDAFRILCTKGVEFFLTTSVGATNRN